jgi:hypothetical protein
LPASDYILIKSPEGFTSLTLYNSIGNVIMTREIDNTFTQIIDIKNYPTGIYILKLSNGNNALSKRFTIIK